MAEELTYVPEPAFAPRAIRIGHPIQARWHRFELSGEPGWETIACVLAEVARGDAPQITVEAWDDTDAPPTLLYCHVGNFERRAYDRLCAKQYRVDDPDPAHQRQLHRLLRVARSGPYRDETLTAIAALAYQERQRRMEAAHRRFVAAARAGGGVGFLGRAIAEVQAELDREARDA